MKFFVKCRLQSTISLGVATILVALLFTGCGGGGGGSNSATHANAVPASLATGSYANSQASFLDNNGAILSDTDVQSLIKNNSGGATISVPEANGSSAYYATSTLEPPTTPNPGVTAATVTMYDLLNSQGLVNIEIANCVKRSDGTYFIDGAITLLRPSGQPQYPAETFQCTVSTESQFVSSFSYSSVTFVRQNGSVISQEAYQTALAYAYLSVTL